MLGLLAFLGVLLLIALGLVTFTAVRLLRLPANAPATFLSRGRPVVACLGDSITHGHLGSDWVSRLRTHLDGRADVVNAGVNSDLAWNLRERLDEVLACRPTVAVLLIGTNDALGTLHESRARMYVRTKRLPQNPDPAWYAENLAGILERLHGAGVATAVCTLPPIGDDDDEAEAARREHTDVLRRVAGERGVPVLELHDALRARRPASKRASPSPASSNAWLRSILVACLQHVLLGWSWDRIGDRAGLSLTTDHVHLTDVAGGVLLEVVTPFVEDALTSRSVG